MADLFVLVVNFMTDHTFGSYVYNKIITNYLTQIFAVYCRSVVVEVLQLLSRIRCNDSILAIAEKYHYEDVIYSHQLLNQDTEWCAKCGWTSNIWQQMINQGNNFKKCIKTIFSHEHFCYKFCTWDNCIFMNKYLHFVINIEFYLESFYSLSFFTY